MPPDPPKLLFFLILATSACNVTTSNLVAMALTHRHSLLTQCCCGLGGRIAGGSTKSLRNKSTTTKGSVTREIKQSSIPIHKHQNQVKIGS